MTLLNMSMTAMVRQVGDAAHDAYEAVLANGTVVATHTDFGVTWNALIDYLRVGSDMANATVGIHAPRGAMSRTSARLYSLLRVVPVGITTVATDLNIPLFMTDPAVKETRFVEIVGLRLLAEQPLPYSQPHILLRGASYSHVANCWFSISHAYHPQNRGGIHLNGGTLNYFYNNHVTAITLEQCSDNWVYQNTVCSWRATQHAIQILGEGNNQKITDNHIIVPIQAGLMIHTGATVLGMSFEQNWIEPQDGYQAGGLEYGVFADGTVRESSFSRNKLNNLGCMGMNFNGGIWHSDISSNVFVNMNRACNPDYRCISFGGKSGHNIIHGNIARNDQTNTNQAPFLFDGVCSTITSNSVTGLFSKFSEGPGTTTVPGGSNLFEQFPLSNSHGQPNS